MLALRGLFKQMNAKGFVTVEEEKDLLRITSDPGDRDRATLESFRKILTSLGHDPAKVFAAMQCNLDGELLRFK